MKVGVFRAFLFPLFLSIFSVTSLEVGGPNPSLPLSSNDTTEFGGIEEGQGAQLHDKSTLLGDFLKGVQCEEMWISGFHSVWKEPTDESAVSVIGLSGMEGVQEAEIEERPVTVLVRIGEKRYPFWFHMFFRQLDDCKPVSKFIFDWWGKGDLFSEERKKKHFDPSNVKRIEKYLKSGRVQVVTGREYSHRYFPPEGLESSLVLNLDDDSYVNCQGLYYLLAGAAESNGKKIITFHNFTRSLSTCGDSRTEQHPCDESLGYEYEFPPNPWERPEALKPLGAMVLPGLSMIPSSLFSLYKEKMPRALLNEITKTVDCDDIALSMLTALENQGTDSEAGVAVKLGKGAWYMSFEDGQGLWRRDDRKYARRHCISSVLKAFKEAGLIDEKWLPKPVSRLLVPAEELEPQERALAQGEGEQEA
uniref:Glycosyl transferase 64 domain-containing protein n=1 Tax=Chromera velia CCMP2878 TaxID=1169474 RepID=A0A0G4HFB3_9ALVE|eukprot:Cvel_6646.t1-p1 / transcript=Cvel_6646.t1 / gene=Cvel_6646 / organism=Chromera_velia_CCMP2878 / gene_product=hypothetical protein / transcript_product=hypothetical protein / location=Cvel_scaffold329:75714-77299(+) / protein_length=418 / sequence_SO=supercontig / SO=protein_coding / is_pseudo=false